MGKFIRELHRSNDLCECNDPSYVQMANCNADNLVGKVFLKNPNDVKMPFCDNFRIIDAKDEVTYSKIKPDAWMMELWSERDILSFGSVIMGLPSASEILSEIKEDLTHFMS